MKAVKRISALLLAVMLLASFTVSAFAEDEPVDRETALASDTPAEVTKTGPETDGAKSVTTENSKDLPDVNVTNTSVTVDFNGAHINVPQGTTYTDSTGGGTVTVTAATEDKPFTVTVDGNIISSNSSPIYAGSKGAGPVAVVTNGDVTSTGTYMDAIHVVADNGNNSSVSVKTAGDASGYYGVYALGGNTDGPGDAYVETHAITSTGSYGLDATAYNGGSTTVTADSVNARTNGIIVRAGTSAYDTDSATVTVTVGSKDEYGNVTGGTVTAGETGIRVKTNTDSAGKVSTAEVDVKGNVTGTTGINVVSDNGTIGQTTITVGTKDDHDSGTVTGGIDLSDSLISGDNTHITLWKVDGPVTGDSAVIEKVMNYFVRQDTPGDNGTLTISNDVINGSENVLLSVTPDSGYVVDTVYYNEKETIKPDTNGYYYLKALPTGGIMLKATFKPDTPVNPDPPTPTPKPAGPVAVFSYKLSFDLDGGVMPDGKTELEMKCSSGQRITLPEAPTKEGFVFAGWQTDVRGKPVVFEAGAKYTVSAAKTFVALWEEA